MTVHKPQTNASVIGLLNAYTQRLRRWLTSRAVAYGVAVGLLCAGGVLLSVAVGVGAAALFYFIELSYGVWTAYGSIGGTFAALGTVASVAAVTMLKRRAAPVPKPPNATKVFQAAALPMVGRLASSTGNVRTADGTTRALAAAAGVLLVGWIASSHATRRVPPPER